MRTIKGTIILLCLAAVATVAGKPIKDLHSEQQKQDVNQPDTNGLGEYYGFGEMEIIKLDYGIQSLQIADFDGDGRNDIAVANNRKAAIEILLQKDSIGPQDQDVAVDPNDIDINALIGPSRFTRQTVPVSQRIYSMVAGDLNGDGLIDLAYYGEPRGLYVLLQKPRQEGSKSKVLSWQPRKRINIDDALANENALVCEDIDNDGKKDLIVVGRDAIYVVLQKKDGTLGEPVKYPSTARIIGVEVGDLNGDGINDLLIVTDDTERPIHVRLGQKNNQLGPEIRLLSELPLALELANIDGKAGQEIVAIDAISRRLTCYKFAARLSSPKSSDGSQDDDWPVLFYPLAAGQGSEKRDLVIGDFDGDGLSDVVVSDPGAAEIIWYKQVAGVGLAEPARFPSLAEADALSAADIDSDGKSELGVLSIKEKTIGISKFEAGRLTFPKAVDLTGEPRAMELTDIDGDKSADCVYISRSQSDVRSLRIIYNVAKADANDALAVELPQLATNPQAIKVIDVDHDGLKDVLIFVKYELPILVRQTQKRKFEVVDSPKAQTSLIKEATLRSISTADIDGRDELLVAQNNFARSMTFANGEWTVLDQYNAKGAENSISAVAAAKMKVDGAKDSKAILLLDGQKGRLQILTPGTDKTYRFDKELDVGSWNPAGGIKMMLASLTGGGPADIVLFDGEKFAIVVPPGGKTNRYQLEQKFTYETKIKDGAYGNLATGDINGDKRVDIVLVEYKHNHIEILALDSAGKPIPAMRFKTFEDKTYRESRPQAPIVEPRQMKVADVTSDGKADLVTIIHDRIIIYPQD
ncbi:MAG: VCBS repeat-containing protein [Sedimentisphaerales bacterium]